MATIWVLIICQTLYTRSIGVFLELTYFVDEAAEVHSDWVTHPNSHSWYVSEFKSNTQSAFQTFMGIRVTYRTCQHGHSDPVGLGFCISSELLPGRSSSWSMGHNLRSKVQPLEQYIMVPFNVPFPFQTDKSSHGNFCFKDFFVFLYIAEMDILKVKGCGITIIRMHLML